ncbi:MAG: shikimate kinase, partial [Bacteroidota bacterium]
MGVAGSGKSTIGQQWAKALGLPFADGDDYHPTANV